MNNLPTDIGNINKKNQKENCNIIIHKIKKSLANKSSSSSSSSSSSQSSKSLLSLSNSKNEEKKSACEIESENSISEEKEENNKNENENLKKYDILVEDKSLPYEKIQSLNENGKFLMNINITNKQAKERIKSIIKNFPNSESIINKYIKEFSQKEKQNFFK